MDRYFLPVN